MLDNFREVYDHELEIYDSEFERLILSSCFVRMFVYEVCKVCLTDRIEELKSENENLHIENDTMCQRLQNEHPEKCTACKGA